MRELVCAATTLRSLPFWHPFLFELRTTKSLLLEMIDGTLNNPTVMASSVCMYRVRRTVPIKSLHNFSLNDKMCPNLTCFVLERKKNFCISADFFKIKNDECNHFNSLQKRSSSELSSSKFLGCSGADHNTASRISFRAHTHTQC